MHVIQTPQNLYGTLMLDFQILKSKMKRGANIIHFGSLKTKISRWVPEKRVAQNWCVVEYFQAIPYNIDFFHESDQKTRS